MGRKKLLKNIISELVDAGYDEVDLTGMDEDVVRAIYDKAKKEGQQPSEETASVEEETDAEETVTEEEVEDALSVIDEQQEQETEQEDIIPFEPYSVNISDQEKILSLFTEEEMDGDYLKVNGLRRIARTIIGPIVDQKVQIKSLSVGSPDTGLYSGVVATVSITFDCKNPSFASEDFITFTDAADCLPSYNADAEYGRYISAFATTRAEARVLRKALGLNAVAAEEVTDLPPITVSPVASTNKISGPQMVAIKKVAGERGISVEEFLKSKDIEKPLNELTQDQGVEVLSALNKAREKKND